MRFCRHTQEGRTLAS